MTPTHGTLQPARGIHTAVLVVVPGVVLRTLCISGLLCLASCVAATDAGAPPPRSGDAPPAPQGDAAVNADEVAAAEAPTELAGCASGAGPSYALPPWVLAGKSGPEAEPTLAALEAEIAAGEAQLSAMPVDAPTRPALLERLAGAYTQAARHDPVQREQAIRTLATLIRDHPGAPDMDRILFALAWQLDVLDQHDRARQVYHRMVRHFPQSPFVPLAYLSFGEFYFEAGDYRAAAQFYDRAREVAVTGLVAAYAAYKEAWSFRQTGQLGPAARSYDTATALAGDAAGGDALIAAIDAESCTDP